MPRMRIGRSGPGAAALLALALGAGEARAQATPPEPAAPPAAPSADPTQVMPGRYRLDSSHGRITWSVNHLGYSTYYGQIAGVAGSAVLDPKEPGRSSLDISIDIATMSTLDPALDGVLRSPDFFDAARHSDARFVSTRVEQTGPTTARITGDLTLRGVTKPVALTATFNQAGIHPVDRLYTVGFDGRAVIRRSEFGVSGFLPGVSDEVTLRLEGEFKKEE